MFLCSLRGRSLNDVLAVIEQHREKHPGVVVGRIHAGVGAGIERLLLPLRLQLSHLVLGQQLLPFPIVLRLVVQKGGQFIGGWRV